MVSMVSYGLGIGSHNKKLSPSPLLLDSQGAGRWTLEHWSKEASCVLSSLANDNIQEPQEDDSLLPSQITHEHV